MMSGHLVSWILKSLLLAADLLSFLKGFVVPSNGPSLLKTVPLIDMNQSKSQKTLPENSEIREIPNRSSPTSSPSIQLFALILVDTGQGPRRWKKSRIWTKSCPWNSRQGWHGGATWKNRIGWNWDVNCICSCCLFVIMYYSICIDMIRLYTIHIMCSLSVFQWFVLLVFYFAERDGNKCCPEGCSKR